MVPSPLEITIEVDQVVEKAVYFDSFVTLKFTYKPTKSMIKGTVQVKLPERDPRLVPR